MFNILLESYVDSHDYSIDKLTYNFVSREKMLELNKEFLKHDTNTDIITFDYSKNKMLRAEFFISLWAIALSAEEFSQSIENETIRVMVHGVLHCLGYKDVSYSDKEQMRLLEDQFLNMFHVKRQNHV
jgi:rRNA maturation RNase YbeY